MTAKLLTECIGTFFLVLTIGCTVMAGSPGVIAPLAIGAVLMVMVYAGGHISGAHYNPAVTLSLFIRGRCSAAEVVPYMVSQVLGAVVATLALGILRPDFVGAAGSVTTTRVFLAEFLFTFALAYVVLNVATAKKNSGNSFYGLAIGSTVMAGAFAVGDISGGIFNPAVAVAACILGLASCATIWVVIAANFLAGAAAGFVFRYLNPEDR